MLIDSEKSPTSIVQECPIEEAIISTISYFSIFNHPLKQAELYNFLSCTIDEQTFQQSLQSLQTKNIVTIKELYIGFAGELSEERIQLREHYERLFQEAIPKVVGNSRLIARFPFVRGVMISGSISKGLMKEDGDIDFFIVTAHNRLWICRTMLILYKKIFRLNSKKYFCLNYFVGEHDLAIPDKNIFTATEIACLIPTVNAPLHQNLLKVNNWYTRLLPNFRPYITLPVNARETPFLTKVLEKIMSNSVGEWLDKKLMRFTYGHWQEKFSDFDAQTIELALRSKRNVSKHHPNNFQEKVLTMLEVKCSKFKV